MKDQNLLKQPPTTFRMLSEANGNYQNVDGTQSTWLVKGEKTIDDTEYQFLERTPAAVDIESDYLIPTLYRSSTNKVLLNISEKVDRYIQTKLPVLVQEEFAGLDVKVEVNPIKYPELLYLEIPVTLNNQWEVLDVKIGGNFILQNLILLNIPWEVRYHINAAVIHEGPIDTPAGNFENAYQIEYQIDITNVVFSNERTIKHNQTIWFVPHIGIVKIEDERGVTELVEYILR